MPWWTAIYKDGQRFTSEDISFKDLPYLYDLDVSNGHIFKTAYLNFVSGRVQVALDSGEIMVDGQIVATVPSAFRILVARRVTQRMQASPPKTSVRLGLVDPDGFGIITIQNEGGTVTLETVHLKKSNAILL